MIDKVQKIKEWISKEQDELMDANGNFKTAADEASYNILCNLDAYIDTLQKEPIIEVLDKAAKQFSTDNETGKVDVVKQSSFFWGAIYHKQQMMAKAVDVTIAIPCQNLDGSYTQLVDSKEALPFGDKLKVLVIKEGRI